MLRPTTAQLYGLLAAPVGALGLATFASWTPDASGRTLTAALASLGAATGVAALAFALDALRMRRAFAHLRRGGGAMPCAAPAARDARRDALHHEQVTMLRRQVEQLSAMRDLALIANDDVSLERILERALAVLGGLLDAQEMAIFLAEGPDRDRLVPVAHRSGERTRVGSDGSLKVAPREAQRALEAQRTIVEPSRGGGLRAAALLVAEGEVMGALEVRLASVQGGVPLDAREVGRQLEALAKHIALAIRKPALYDRAVIDALTGLYSKRHFLEQVQQLMAARVRLGTPLALIVIDVDHFKRVNDGHGHVAGDAVLAEVARRIKSCVRGYDQCFRYGGEEMIVLSPNTSLEDAAALAERLRKKLRGAPIKAGEVELSITASFGVACFDPATMADHSAFLEKADQHLYVAKRNGRDQVRSDLNPLAAAPPAPAVAPAVDAAPLATSTSARRAVDKAARATSCAQPRFTAPRAAEASTATTAGTPAPATDVVTSASTAPTTDAAGMTSMSAAATSATAGMTSTGAAATSTSTTATSTSTTSESADVSASIASQDSSPEAGRSQPARRSRRASTVDAEASASQPVRRRRAAASTSTSTDDEPDASVSQPARRSRRAAASAAVDVEAPAAPSPTSQVAGVTSPAPAAGAAEPVPAEVAAALTPPPATSQASASPEPDVAAGASQRRARRRRPKSGLAESPSEVEVARASFSDAA